MFSLFDISTPTIEFDSEYYPYATEIKMLTEDEWNMPYTKKPEWLGFIYANKSFKLEAMPKGTYPSTFNKMEKVLNPYLDRAFQLQKSKSGLPTIDVYHATSADNIESIMENNFNWRFAGKSRGWKYGRGVCFSKNRPFIYQFCRGPEKRFIKTKVLYRRACVGSEGDLLPDYGYDSSISRDGKVIVKFEDSEFLPFCIYHKSRF